MTTTIVAARIDDEVKKRADKVLAAAQLTPTQLVRRVYDYIANVGDVPEFMKVDEHEVVLETPGYRNDLLQEILTESREAMGASARSYASTPYTREMMKRELGLLLEQKVMHGRRMGIDYEDLSEVYPPEDLEFLGAWINPESGDDDIDDDVRAFVRDEGVS